MGSPTPRFVLPLLLLGCGAKTGLSPADAPDAAVSADANLSPDVERSDASEPSADARLPSGACGEALDAAVLVENPNFAPQVLTTHGGYLYFNATHDRASTEAPSGGIYRVATAGGAVEPIATEHAAFAGPLMVNAAYMAFYEADVRGGGSSWSVAYPNLIVRDMRTGEETVLPTSVVGESSTVAADMDARGRLFFVDKTRGSAVLMGHDPSVGRTTPLLEGDDIRQVDVRDDRIYWHTYDRGGNQAHTARLDSTTMALRDIQPLGVTGGYACCGMIGADAARLYTYRQGQRRIESLAWRDPARPMLVADDVAMEFAFDMDTENIYWGDGDDGATLSYVPKTGGAAATLYAGDTDWIEYVHADDRCVYFSVVNPPRILVQRSPRGD